MFLHRIVKDTADSLTRRKEELPLDRLERMISSNPPPLDFAIALQGDSINIIAEVKKASPSKGIICTDFNPVKIAQSYAENGAAAISVLTETRYFLGSLKYMALIKNTLGDKAVPLLRKDFIFDPYQVYESRAYGADALLLIAAILDAKQLISLISLADSLGMSCLVEIHDEKDLEIALQAEARIIGINNRDLKTFSVDIATTARIAPLVPRDKLIVSESGIASREDIELLKKSHVNAVLIGEALMTAKDMAAKFREVK